MKATNRVLISFHTEIEETRRSQSVWGFLLAGRIKEFYKYNGIKVNSIIENTKKINKKYYEYELLPEAKEETIKFTKPDPEKPNERPKSIFKEGVKEEDFNKEWDELMKREVEILI